MAKPKILHCSMRKTPTCATWTPSAPDSIDRPRSRTTSVADVAMPMLVTSPLMAKTPANVPVQSMVIDFVIANPPPPKSPASRQLMLPPGLVFARAPPKVRHGDVMVHTLASLPKRETQDRAFCACAVPTFSKRQAVPTSERDSRYPFTHMVALHDVE